MRGLSAVYVVLGHSVLTVWPLFTPQFQNALPLGENAWTYLWTIYGRYAVALFIVVSGFVLALPVVRQGLALEGGAKRFFIRRVIRILPPYYAAMGFSLIMIMLLIGTQRYGGDLWNMSIPGDPPWPITTEGLLANLFLYQNIAGNPEINGVFWSIALESQIYVLFPLLVLLGRRLGYVFITILCVAVGVALYYMVMGTRHHPASPHFLGLFAMGMLAARLVRGEGRWKAAFERIPWFWIGLVSFVALVTVAKPPEFDNIFHGRTGWQELLMGVVATCLILAGYRWPNGAVARAFGKPKFVKLGAFSYSLYLIHMPIVESVYRYVVEPIATFPVEALIYQIALAVPLSIAAAYGFYLVIERPCLVALRRMSERERAQRGKA
jgi:peptidoglycan/LPS O-acetylase OafA/YrhL